MTFLYPYILLNTIFWAYSHTSPFIKLNWWDKFLLCLFNNNDSNSFITLDQILIGLNLPIFGVLGWSLYNKIDLPIKHLRDSEIYQNYGVSK